MAKGTKAAKQLEAARKTAASVRRRANENEAELKKKLTETRRKASAKVQEVLGGRPVIETVTATAAGMATGYLGAMIAHKQRVANQEDTTAGTEVSKFSEWMGDQGNVGLLFSLAGSAAALAVSPKSPMARKVVQGVGIGLSAGGAALKGASMYRQQDTVDGPAWRGVPPAWRGAPADANARAARLQQNSARIRALLAARAAQRGGQRQLTSQAVMAGRVAPQLYQTSMADKNAF